jgi:hypothetical protein
MADAGDGASSEVSVPAAMQALSTEPVVIRRDLNIIVPIRKPSRWAVDHDMASADLFVAALQDG